MLKVENLVKSFGGVAATRDITLDFPDGSLTAVIGPNGAGKTTLFNLITGHLTPDSGKILLDGEDIVGLSPAQVVHRGLGRAFQVASIFPSLTVLEHLTVLKPARATHGWTVARAFDAFPRLAERRANRGGELSGGERGMLAIARALMTDPKLLLMDEPSEGLSPVMVQHVETIIRTLKAEGLAILLVEQNLQSALASADRAYVLESGRVVHEFAAGQDPAILAQILGVS